MIYPHEWQDHQLMLCTSNTSMLTNYVSQERVFEYWLETWGGIPRIMDVMPLSKEAFAVLEEAFRNKSLVIE